jgi:hypothetical protein
MQDGTYTVRLILRDKVGHTYREAKTFVIASKPPVVQVKLDRKRFRRGQTIESESQRLGKYAHPGRAHGRQPCPLSCTGTPKSAANTGELTIPEQAIPGIYKLTVTAEDIAHNIGTRRCRLKYFLESSFAAHAPRRSCHPFAVAGILGAVAAFGELPSWIRNIDASTVLEGVFFRMMSLPKGAVAISPAAARNPSGA